MYLGQIGRKICPINGYNFDDVKGAGELVPVDLVIRSYFFHSSVFSSIHALKKRLMQSNMSNLLYHDDMVLAVCKKGDVFVMPRGEDDTRCNIKELDAPFGVSHYAGRREDRTRTWLLLNSLYTHFYVAAIWQ